MLLFSRIFVPHYLFKIVDLPTVYYPGRSAETNPHFVWRIDGDGGGGGGGVGKEVVVYTGREKGTCSFSPYDSGVAISARKYSAVPLVSDGADRPDVVVARPMGR